MKEQLDDISETETELSEVLRIPRSYPFSEIEEDEDDDDGTASYYTASGEATSGADY